MVDCGKKTAIDELIDYNQKSRKVSKLFSNVFNGEGSGSHSSHSENFLKDKLAKKKKKILSEQEKIASRVSSGGNVQNKATATITTPVTYPAQLIPIAEVRNEAELVSMVEPEEDIYAMKADPKKSIIKETADILNSIGATPKVDPVVVEVETIISSSDSDSESNFSGDDQLVDARRCVWDYATALDDEDVTSHRCVTCVPDSLLMSKV